MRRLFGVLQSWRPAEKKRVSDSSHSVEIVSVLLVDREHQDFAISSMMMLLVESLAQSGQPETCDVLLGTAV